MDDFHSMPDTSASEANPQASREAGVALVESEGAREFEEGGTGIMHDGQAATDIDNAGRSADIRRKRAMAAAPSFNEVHQRIQSATNTRTQSELANILGIRQSSISDAKRRNRVPSSWYMLLFEKFGLSQDWLRYGIGPMFLRTEQGYAPQESSDTGLNPAQYGDPAAKSTLVTVYSMRCRLNGAERMPKLDAIGKLALPSNFVGPDTLVLRMLSNEMAPTIRQGGHLGVNTSEISPLSGGVFVLKDAHAGLLVRRIFLDYGSKNFVLRSDNEKCPESMVPAKELAEHVVGRVSWVMQKLA